MFLEVGMVQIVVEGLEEGGWDGRWMSSRCLC